MSENDKMKVDAFVRTEVTRLWEFARWYEENRKRDVPFVEIAFPEDGVASRWRDEYEIWVNSVDGGC